MIAAIVLPELLHLVSSEIGAKDKKRRGFAPAITALVFVLLYIGLRAELHATAVAQLQNRAYAGESPQASRGVLRLYVAGYVARNRGDGKRASRGDGAHWIYAGKPRWIRG